MTRVLIVEDDEPLRHLMRTWLARSTGFDVVGEAEDGRDAIERAAELRPDLILLDVRMPVMNGLEALPHIRRRSPRSTIVVLSMLQDDETRARAMALGAQAYLDKGMPPQELVAEIRRVVASAAAPTASRPRAARTRRP